MASDVVIKMSAEDAQVVQAWQRAKRGPGELANELDKVKKKSGEAKTGADQMIGSFAKWAIGLASVKQAFDLVLSANREFEDQVFATGQRLDAMQRRFMAQAGLTRPQGADAQRAIGKVAIEFATPGGLAAATADATALIAAGFSQKEATGGGLRAIQAFRAATGSQEEDVSAVVDSMASFLKSQGLGLTGENVNRLAVPLTGLFAQSFQAGDLQEIAGVGAALRPFMSISEQFAAFTTLRKQLGSPAESATALRNVVGRLTSAEASTQRQAALSEIGLKPEDVDLIGENLAEAMAKIAQGLDTLPEGRRAGILAKLFEEAGATSAQVLMSSLGDLARFERVQGEGAGLFELGVEQATSGTAAALRRAEIAGELQRMERADEENRFRSEVELTRQKGRDLGGIGVAVAESSILAARAKRLVGLGFGDNANPQLETGTRQAFDVKVEVQPKQDRSRPPPPLPAQARGRAP